MGEWTTLGDVISRFGGSIKTGPFGTALKAAEYATVGVPLISVGEVGYGSLRIFDKTPRVSDSTTSRLSDYVLRHGDIVFGRKGAVDRSAWIQEHEDGYFLGSDGIRVRVGAGLSSRFLAYQFRSENVRSWLIQHAAGTTMLSLNQKILERVPIILPDLNIQRAIAGVLGALDNKIAANDRLADTARVLMAEQFAMLDVVPEGGGHSDPDGNVRVDELLELNPKTVVAKSDETPYLEMKNLPDRAMTVSTWSYRPAKGGARFRNGDTLLARITPCLENGKTGYVDFLKPGQIGIGSTEFIVLRSRTGVPTAFPYFLVKNPSFREYAIRRMVGTSGRQRLSASDVGGYVIKRPSGDRLRAFGEMTDSLLERVKAAVDESRTLATTRDELLPLLMSGKIRVKDAEVVASEVL